MTSRSGAAVDDPAIPSGRSVLSAWNAATAAAVPSVTAAEGRVQGRDGHGCRRGGRRRT